MTLAPVLFDLDGTLIDSAPSILESMGAAFAELGARPVCPLEPSLIGPPLISTLLKLRGDAPCGPAVEELVSAFKAHYDREGYRGSVAIEPMPALLDELAAQGRELYIVTNKRLHPTLLILEHLGWRGRFSGVYALDSLTPAATNKALVLKHVVTIHVLPAARCWYVGDRDEDEKAAAAAGLPCLRVPWGYGGGNEAAPSASALDGFRQRLRQEPGLHPKPEYTYSNVCREAVRTAAKNNPDRAARSG